MPLKMMGGIEVGGWDRGWQVGDTGYPREDHESLWHQLPESVHHLTYPPVAVFPAFRWTWGLRDRQSCIGEEFLYVIGVKLTSIQVRLL